MCCPMIKRSFAKLKTLTMINSYLNKIKIQIFENIRKKYRHKNISVREINVSVKTLETPFYNYQLFHKVSFKSTHENISTNCAAVITPVLLQFYYFRYFSTSRKTTPKRLQIILVFFCPNSLPFCTICESMNSQPKRKKQIFLY